MGSARNFWTTADLLKDWRYWRRAFPLHNREKARASARFLTKRWGFNVEYADQAAQHAVECGQGVRSTAVRYEKVRL